MRIALNDGWEYVEKFNRDFLFGKKVEVEQVRLPHSCVELSAHYFYANAFQLICGYRREIPYNQEWKDKKILLTFMGAAHEATVYLNGKELMIHSCGYTAFQVELTGELKPEGENLLAVRLNCKNTQNIPPFGGEIDYMTYGGLYREVYLDIKNVVYIKDIALQTSITEFKENKRYGDCELNVDVKFNEPPKGYILEAVLKEGEKEELLTELLVKEDLSLSFDCSNVLLWSVRTPRLYELVFYLKKYDDVVDINVQRFGFREVSFEEDGFYLNRKKLRIMGMNRHQSFPYVGYAMPKSMQREDARILKEELGVNAVRTSHYPQSQYFIDRCDELGILVFMEIPGWKYIGNEDWKNQAVDNTREMVTQYRNHPSIILWGIRINESADDDDFYTRTNEAAHELDSRQTSGVRCIAKSSLLEDVYSYNDFSHDGTNEGILPKKKVTSDMKKPYLVSEYCGHMFPTKNYDDENHKREQMLRHAIVLNDIGSQKGVAGGFAWCMADYQTTKGFGSGDGICYHGVMDQFRNPKPAAAVYASQQNRRDVLEVASSMETGDYAGMIRGELFVLTNADKVRLYRNNKLVKEYEPDKKVWKNLKHPPILIDETIGEVLEEQEEVTKKEADKVRSMLNALARYGVKDLPRANRWRAASLMKKLCLTTQDVQDLYNTYIGSQHRENVNYRFEAVKKDKVVGEVVKAPVHKPSLEAIASHIGLVEGDTYDVAAVRIHAVDDYGNVLPYYQEALTLEAFGEIEVIGPSVISLKGGMGGTYVKTHGRKGAGMLTITGEAMETVKVIFTITVSREDESTDEG